MNITVTVDDEILARARELASRRGTSVDQLIQDYLEELAADVKREQALRELEALWATSSGRSGTRDWTREELHEAVHSG